MGDMEIYWVAPSWGHGYRLDATMLGTRDQAEGHCDGDTGTDWGTSPWGHGGTLGDTILGRVLG